MALGIDWVGFVPAAAVVAVVPGANQLLSLRNALRQGAGDAAVALVGRFSAFAILVVLVATGLGGLAPGSGTALAVIRWCGVAYLGWLGLAGLWRSFRPDASNHVNAHEARPRGRRSLVRQEFVVAITNPKALLLFAALLPQFVVHVTVPACVQLLILGGSYIGVEAITALGYALVGGCVGSFDLTHRARRCVDRVAATSFLGLATYLAFSG